MFLKHLRYIILGLVYIITLRLNHAAIKLKIKKSNLNAGSAIKCNYKI